MTPPTTQTTPPPSLQTTRAQQGGTPHPNRTAKVVELVCTSAKGFEDAIQCGLEDARQTTRDITGAHVQGMSIRCDNGRVVEYKVDLKVAFGLER